MTNKKSVDGQPVLRKKYTPACKVKYVRQVAAGARQSDIARAQGIAPALLGRWQRSTLEQAVPSSAECEEVKRPRAELKRVEIAGTSKPEVLPHGGAFASLAEARLEVAYYLSTHFNLDRRHSALGYRSPHRFEIALLNHLP